MKRREWQGFIDGVWTKTIDVRGFIQKNHLPYSGDESFLTGASLKTQTLWARCAELIEEENKKGVLAVDCENIAGIDNFQPGYIDRKNEVILGLQTDEPLKRMINPYGGVRMAEEALRAYGYFLNDEIGKIFNEIRKTHNQGVFDVYTDEIMALRKAGILTGLPDSYGRGRIIGDFRRIPLYGVGFLIEQKRQDLIRLGRPVTEDLIRTREEVAEQIRALEKMKKMAAGYGVDISRPAGNAKEAVQFLYFGYLAGVKENNGAAMSLGRCSTFLDVYLERDLRTRTITEEEAQELIDQFIIKLRLVRHLRTSEYNELFGGDPNWITEAVGGMTLDNRTLVSKTSYRFLHSLINLGPAPEPNMTVLWSESLPPAFKRFCAKMSLLTNAIQYENDELMRPLYGDDYAIACCVSAMTIGKQMQYFGARCNLAKSLLYALNGGRDENSGIAVVPGIGELAGEYPDYEAVKENFFKVLAYVAERYVEAINIIHYMHDKYAYEKGLMALHDTEVERIAAFGVAGLSVAADSLSALKYGGVKVERCNGITSAFFAKREFPLYGNDDDRADELAVMIVKRFYGELQKHTLYRGAKPTLSVLTITSNVAYGKKTGATPDGRKAQEAFAPGANPMHGRDKCGALASLNSVAKLPYAEACRDGISNTFSIIPQALGKNEEKRIGNLIAVLDGYFIQGAQHLNVNVLSPETLRDAMENPHKYPTLTVRVSGYAVRFNKLTREQQLEVVQRTFHKTMAG